MLAPPSPPIDFAPLPGPRMVDPHCPRCNGTGTVIESGDGQGPWTDKQMVPCPLCN